MKILKKIFFSAAILTSVMAFSQEKKEDIKLTIIVKDYNNNPIPGAIILIDNKKQDRTTNENGNFKITLKISPNEIAAFSPSIGIKKIKYKGETNLELVLTENKDLNLLSENTNYKNDNPIQYRNIYDYLRGKVPGVNIDSENRIIIRGYNSINGSRNPLLILNGNPIEQDAFSNIVTTDIKYIKVLKGTETSAYGSRGANGVIIVQTL
ncbi:TonB-dependent receptor plug domain-containing protein [Polaribacter sp.]|uniref:TonB-dependent receptor plug domain-containing protein n=1 Tax=Polaribacter sp. TaxID=1920175 RepID=UPI0040489486